MTEPSKPQSSNSRALSLAQIAYNAHKESAKTQRFKLLEYGRTGTGKTRIFKTARRPVFICSFDPGGYKTLIDEIDGRTFLVDSRFESEDPWHPKAWALFDKVFHELKASGFFSMVGTFGLDSLTTMAQTALNWVMAKDKRAGTTPFQQDWYPQMVLVENFLHEMLDLPCDCILTAHPDVMKDDVTGKTFATPMITGKLKGRIPLLFDEVYYADAVESSKGTEWHLITRKTSMYDARTRLGREGRFDLREKPDIKYLLEKAGYDYHDLPPLEIKVEGGESKE